MNSKQIIRSLNIIKNRLNEILEPEAERVINTAISSLKNSKTEYDRYQKRKDLLNKPVNDWGYQILEPPLRFKVANCKGYHLRPDIICNFRWQKEGALPTIMIKRFYGFGQAMNILFIEKNTTLRQLPS